jgi:hypothetical protein
VTENFDTTGWRIAARPRGCRTRSAKVGSGRQDGLRVLKLDGHPPRWQPLRDDPVRRHAVYGGVFDLNGQRALERVFEDSGPDVDARIPAGTVRCSPWW